MRRWGLQGSIKGSLRISQFITVLKGSVTALAGVFGSLQDSFDSREEHLFWVLLGLLWFLHVY